MFGSPIEFWKLDFRIKRDPGPKSTCSAVQPHTPCECSQKQPTHSLDHIKEKYNRAGTSATKSPSRSKDQVRSSFIQAGNLCMYARVWVMSGA